MRPYLKGEYYDSVFLLSAMVSWLLCAVLLLTLSSVILNELGCNEQALGYVSSSISFISAACAGAAASRKRKRGIIYTSLLTATVIVISVLTLGFLIDGPAIEPSAIMSIISFTYTGCLLGVYISKPSKTKNHFKARI